MNYTLLESSAPRSVTITVPFTTWYKVYMAGPGGKRGSGYQSGTVGTGYRIYGGGNGGGGFGTTLRVLLTQGQKVTLTSAATYVRFAPAGGATVTAFKGGDGGMSKSGSCGAGGAAGSQKAVGAKGADQAGGIGGAAVSLAKGVIPNSTGVSGATGGQGGQQKGTHVNNSYGTGGVPRGEAFPFGFSSRNYGHGADNASASPGKGAILFMLAP